MSNSKLEYASIQHKKTISDGQFIYINICRFAKKYIPKRLSMNILYPIIDKTVFPMSFIFLGTHFSLMVCNSLPFEIKVFIQV